MSNLLALNIQLVNLYAFLSLSNSFFVVLTPILSQPITNWLAQPPIYYFNSVNYACLVLKLEANRCNLVKVFVCMKRFVLGFFLKYLSILI